MNTISREQLVKTIKSSQWLVQGFNGLPLYLHNVASITGWMIKEVCGVNYTHFFLRMHDTRAKYYYDENDLLAIGLGYYKKNKNTRQLLNFVRSHKTRYLEARRQTGKVPRQLKTLPFQQLVGLAGKLSHELTMSIGMAHVIEGISFVSETKLREILEQRDGNTHKNFQLLSSPVKPSFLSLAQTALWSIKSAPKSKKAGLVKNFLKNFGWIENSYVRGKIMSETDVLKKARHQKSLTSKTARAQAKRRKTNLIKSLGLSKKELFVVQTVDICASWQDERKKLLMQTIGRFEPVLDEIAVRLNLTPEQFKYLCPKELNYKTLTNKKFITELAERFPQSAYFKTENAYLVFSGRDSAYIDKRLEKNTTGSSKELKGMVANRGLVRGKVRICRGIDDIPKVQKGEILVASMTRPEFLPAMQKASGFITDEGGITSHAAIVSREMNKPCVIGTKIATEVLKDGDLVELDANKGIVKLLK
jgi:phosphohistidine swiveling domain-containing protein